MSSCRKGKQFRRQERKTVVDGSRCVSDLLTQVVPGKMLRSTCEGRAAVWHPACIRACWKVSDPPVAATCCGGNPNIREKKTLLQKMFTKGTMPILERAMYFGSRRHKVLANNVANANTPYFTPSDLKVGDFRATMREAIENRERKTIKTFEMPAGAPIREEGGSMVLEVIEESSGSLMFHDRSKMSMEKEMTRLTKNAGYRNQMVELLKKEIGQLRAAISGRGG